MTTLVVPAVAVALAVVVSAIASPNPISAMISTTKCRSDL
jgi:hypothetical protein